MYSKLVTATGRLVVDFSIGKVDTAITLSCLNFN